MKHADESTSTASPTKLLWSQREAAYALGVSVRYLRDSNCPKVFLQGNGPKGQPLVKYDPSAVRSWALAWATNRTSPRSV